MLFLKVSKFKISLAWIVVITTPLLFLIPNALPLNSSGIVKAGTAALALCLIAALYLSKSHVAVSAARKPFLLALTITWVVMVARGQHYGTLNLGAALYLLSKLVITAGMAVAMTEILRSPDNTRSLPISILAVLIPPSISLALYLTGIRNDVHTWFDDDVDFNAVMLGSMGLHIERARFILASGINSFATHGGICLIAALILLSHRRFLLPGLLTLSLGLCITFLIDSRSLMIMAPAAFLISRWLINQKALTISLFVIASPLLVVALLALFAGMNAYDIDLPFSRNGENILTLNARTKVWVSALSKILSSDFNHLLGHGAYGASTSGITDTLGTFAFEAVADIDRIPMHNVYLQYFVDSGFIGLIIYLAANAAALHALSQIEKKSQSINAKFSFNGIVFFLLYGNTEICGSLYGDDSFPIYAVLIATAHAASMMNRTINDRTSSAHPSQFPATSSFQ